MPAVATAGLTIFTLVMFAGLFSIISGLPGTIIILAAAVVYALVTGFGILGLKVLGVLAVIAALTESLDVLFIMNGARGPGFSKAGLISSVLGGLAGAAILTPVFMGLGALAGILLGGITANIMVETFKYRNRKTVTYKSIFGDAARKLIKGISGTAMVLIVLFSVYS